MVIRTSTRSVVALVAFVGVLAALAGVAVAQREPGAPAAPPVVARGTAQPKRPMADMFGRMIPALRETEGCLGVDTGRMMSGKQTIFAWFENKEAALRWYRSDAHKELMTMFFPEDAGDHDHAPMKDVPSDVPVLAIASLTPADAPNPETNLPVSQIAIELYTPVSGGLFLGGRFAPESLVVKGMDDYTPKAAGSSAR